MPLERSSTARGLAIDFATKPPDPTQGENVIAGAIDEDEVMPGIVLADDDGALFLDDDGSFLTD